MGVCIEGLRERIGTVTSTPTTTGPPRCLLHTWLPVAGLQQLEIAEMRLYRPLFLQSAPARPSKAPDAGVSSGSASAAPPPPPSVDKPAHDVVAGAMARAASQSTIHPLDTMKVRMQAGGLSGAFRNCAGRWGARPCGVLALACCTGNPWQNFVTLGTCLTQLTLAPTYPCSHTHVSCSTGGKAASSSSSSATTAAASSSSSQKAPLLGGPAGLRRSLAEVASLYKGVVSAATGAGIIIGAYFAFYSTSKRFLREKTAWKDGEGWWLLSGCSMLAADGGRASS